MMNTPILLITFNRPDHTRRVLDRILEAKPQELYVFQDGAREGNANDVAKCAEVRQVIDTLWNNYLSHEGPKNEKQQPRLHRYYSDINLGCGPGPMTGITWFFDNVEQGIVMEDDCLAHPDFFGYCEELLRRYKNYPQVQFINSTLYHDRWKCDASYGFSHYMVTGAWAAWRRTWQGFDLDLHSLDAKAFRRQVYRLTKSKTEADWWYAKVKDIQRDTEKKSYWDFQMQVHLFLNNAFTIHPKVNLISNIGFDAEGTHTLANDGRGDKSVFPILPLEHPKEVAIAHYSLDIDCFGKTKPQKAWAWFVHHIYLEMLYSEGWMHRLLMKYKSIKHGK